MFSEEEKMGPLVQESGLPEALLKAGRNLLKPHSSTRALLHLLNEAEAQLSKVVQDPIFAVANAMRPLMKALVSAHLLRNRDSDVRVYVVSCLTEIMRITAPEALYNDSRMKEIFHVTVEAFGKLADAYSPSYEKAVMVLDTVSRVRSSLLMLDLECDDLILKMFRRFLKVLRPNHPESVLLSMETIMVTVIDGCEEVPMDLLEILLEAVKIESQDVSPMASWLVEKVLISCACKLQLCIMEAVKYTGTSLDMYSPVVLAICQGEAEENIVVKPKQGQLDLRLSLKGKMSRRLARCGTRAHGDDNVRDGNDLKQLLKQVRSGSTDGEADSGASLPTKARQTNQFVVSSLSPSSMARKGSRKRSRSKIEETNLDAGSLATPPSKKHILKKHDPGEENFMESDTENPEDSIKTAKSSIKEGSQNGSAKASARKTRAKSKEERAHNGLAKTSAKKPLAKSKEERAQNGSAKASARKTRAKSKEERAHNGLAKTSAKKPLAKSKEERAQNGLAKTFAQKPPAESKRVETSRKKSVHSESTGASMDRHIPLSSKSKMKISRAMMSSTKESDQTPKSRSKRKRTAGEDVESHKSELGEELVGKRMKVWWPLDKKFYEGVIKSYCSRKKKHEVSYTDGDVENLNLKKERWEIIQETYSSCEEKEIDLPDSTLLSDIMRRQKAKKSKTVCKNVELSTSSDVRSSMKKDHLTNSSKQGKRTRGSLKGVSNEPESREEQYLKSSKEPGAETGRTKGRAEKRQRVTRSMYRESKKDCDDKEEAESKGDDSLKFGKEPDAEHECKRDHQVLPDDSNAEPEMDGEEQEVAKELIAEPETDGEEHKAAIEPAVDPKVDGEERQSVKETNEVPNTEVQDRESAKEAPAETKLIEKEDMSKEKESSREAYTSKPETGNVENEAEEDDQEETDKGTGRRD